MNVLQAFVCRTRYILQTSRTYSFVQYSYWRLFCLYVIGYSANFIFVLFHRQLSMYETVSVSWRHCCLLTEYWQIIDLFKLALAVWFVSNGLCCSVTILSRRHSVTSTWQPESGNVRCLRFTKSLFETCTQFVILKIIFIIEFYLLTLYFD